MTVSIAGAILGAVLSIVGIIMSWRQSNEAVRRAGEDVSRARELLDEEHSGALRGADAERAWSRAGLIRPSRGDMPHMPLLYEQLRARRARPEIRVGLGVAGAGALVSLLSALLGP